MLTEKSPIRNRTTVPTTHLPFNGEFLGTRVMLSHLFVRRVVTGNWFLPAQRYASAGNSDHNVSVRTSVCLSVTRQYCVKTKKASGMISSPSGSPKTLVF